jgi:MFS family permease
MLAIVPIALGLTSPISGSLSDRFGTRPITVVGLLALLVGYYAVSTLSDETTTLGYVLRLLPIGIGMGVFQSPNNSAIMGTAPRERMGVVSGLLSMARTLGGTIGVSALGALWAGRVFHHTGGALPGGATAASAAAQVAGLQDTFLAAVILIALALALSVWGLVQEWSTRRITRPVQPLDPLFNERKEQWEHTETLQN